MFEDRKYDRLAAVPLMRGAAERYVEKGIRPGQCLTAIICNDLFLAFAYADPETTLLMAEICKWMYNDIPGPAWGSKKQMEAWIDAGGVEGHMEARGKENA